MKPATAALALLVGVAPLLCFSGLYDAANLPQSAWIGAGAWLLLAACLVTPGLRLGAPPLVLLALLAWAGLTLLRAETPQPGLDLWTHWVSCAAVFVAARALLAASEARRQVLFALHASATLVALVGLAQYLWGFGLLPQAFPPAATFVNKNVGAGFVVLAWPFGLWLWRETDTRLTQRLIGLGLAFEAAYVFCAFSRSAWLAVGAQLLVLLAWRLGPKKRRLLLFAPLLLGVLALVLQGLPGKPGEAARHLTSAWRAFGSEPTIDASVVSVRGRLAVWSNTLALVRERPLAGVGLGGLRRAYPPYAHAVQPDPLFSAEHQLDFAHNDYLQVASEQGLTGVVLLFGLLWVAGRALWRGSRSASRSERGLFEAAALVLTGACVDAAFSFPLERALPPLLLALAAACATPEDAPIGPPRRRPLLAGLALLAAVAFGVHSTRTLLADRLTARMFAAQARRDLAQVRVTGEQALVLNPSAFEPAFVLAVASLDQGDPAAALGFVEQALRQRPHDPATLGTRAAVFGRLGELGRAEADARRVAELLPRDASAQYEWGRWLERAGRTDESRQAFERACAQAPTRADYQLKLGAAAFRSGHTGQAVEAAQAALRLQPDLAAAHKLVGLAWLADPTRKPEALEHLRRALALEPGSSDAARLRSLVEEAERPVSPAPSGAPRRP